MSAKQRTDTAGAFGLLDLGQNALLKLGGEMATLGLRHDFGIGAGGRDGADEETAETLWLFNVRNPSRPAL